MNVEQYRKLIGLDFLDGHSGRVKFHTRGLPYDYKKVMDELILPQLTCKLDLKNLIILNPDGQIVCETDKGERFPITHCTYPVDITHFFKKKGIKFKKNISATARAHSQERMELIIVQDGVAYTNMSCANPLSNTLCVHWSGGLHSVLTSSAITITEKDLKFLDFTNKEIIFSGCFVKRLRENKI